MVALVDPGQDIPIYTALLSHQKYIIIVNVEQRARLIQALQLGNTLLVLNVPDYDMLVGTGTNDQVFNLDDFVNIALMEDSLSKECELTLVWLVDHNLALATTNEQEVLHLHIILANNNGLWLELKLNYLL